MKEENVGDSESTTEISINSIPEKIQLVFARGLVVIILHREDLIFHLIL